MADMDSGEPDETAGSKRARFRQGEGGAWWSRAGVWRARRWCVTARGEAPGPAVSCAELRSSRRTKPCSRRLKRPADGGGRWRTAARTAVDTTRSGTNLKFEYVRRETFPSVA